MDTLNSIWLALTYDGVFIQIGLRTQFDRKPETPFRLANAKPGVDNSTDLVRINIQEATERSPQSSSYRREEYHIVIGTQTPQ